MLRAMSWADQQIWMAIRDCPASQAESLPLLAHVLGAEHIWLSRLQNQAPSQPVWPTLTLAECEKLASDNAMGYESLVNSLSDDDLMAETSYRTFRGDEFTNSVIDILTHVVVHGAYHRGQIAKSLGRAGVAAVNTDYITFARVVDPTGA
jgi:uncharacterized damage-inducible protein DinB